MLHVFCATVATALYRLTQAFTLLQVQLLIDRPGNEWTMHELVRLSTTCSANI